MTGSDAGPGAPEDVGAAADPGRALAGLRRAFLALSGASMVLVALPLLVFAPSMDELLALVPLVGLMLVAPSAMQLHGMLVGVERAWPGADSYESLHGELGRVMSVARFTVIVVLFYGIAVAVVASLGRWGAILTFAGCIAYVSVLAFRLMPRLMVLDAELRTIWIKDGCDDVSEET